MMKSHYQRGQKILKDDLKERKKKVKNSWTTLKSSPLFYLDLFKNDNGNDGKQTYGISILLIEIQEYV